MNIQILRFYSVAIFSIFANFSLFATDLSSFPLEDLENGLKKTPIFEQKDDQQEIVQTTTKDSLLLSPKQIDSIKKEAAADAINQYKSDKKYEKWYTRLAYDHEFLGNVLGAAGKALVVVGSSVAVVDDNAYKYVFFSSGVLLAAHYFIINMGKYYANAANVKKNEESAFTGIPQKKEDLISVIDVTSGNDVEKGEEK